VRGLAISRAARHHGGEVRLECGNAEVASLQPQSLADMVAVNAPFTRGLSFVANGASVTRSTASGPLYLIKGLAVRARSDRFRRITYRRLSVSSCYNPRLFTVRPGGVDEEPNLVYHADSQVRDAAYLIKMRIYIY